MVKQATDRLKVNPALGTLPVLQYALPGQLLIDEGYQRSIENGDSQALIRQIAQHWNWDLCQPLVVSRRADGSLWVIDGQHRLAAARLRGDIAQLPCVVLTVADAKDEAAAFVHLNQQRKPLSRLELFRSAVASGDAKACAILNAIEAAGLSLAPHMTISFWKPGMIGNVGGIEAAWAQHGAAVATEGLEALSAGFAGSVLSYAGTLYPGIVAVCADEMTKTGSFAPARFALFTAMLGEIGQNKLRARVMRARADDPNLKFKRASAQVIRAAWVERMGERACRPAEAEGALTPPVMVKASPPAQPKAAVSLAALAPRWCDQCDRKVSAQTAAACTSRFCRAKGIAA